MRRVFCWIRDASPPLDSAPCIFYSRPGTGYITRENLKALLGDEWTSAKVDTMMKEADTKGDGRIGEGGYTHI